MDSEHWAMGRCVCGHKREAHESGVGVCIDWCWSPPHQTHVRCGCERFAAVDALEWRARAIHAAGEASRADASLRRSLLMLLGMEDSERRAAVLRERSALAHAGEAVAHGYAFAVLYWLRWALALALVVVAACSRSVDMPLDAALTDAGVDGGRHHTAACTRAANVADAADVRLGCHIVPGCSCELTGERCDVDDATRDACIAARTSATTCAQLADPSCAFSPLFPESP